MTTRPGDPSPERPSPAERRRVARRVAAVCGLLAVGLLVAGVPWTGHAADDEGSETSKIASEPPGTWHATAFVRGGDMALRVIDYWSKGASMRAETVIGGRPVTTLVHGDRYVVYEGTTGIGLDVQRSPDALAADRVRPRPFAFELEDIVGDGGEKIDEQKLGGVSAEVWQVTDERGRRKVWIATDAFKVPVRAQTFDRRTGATIEIDYSNWVFELPMEDRFFRPPAGLSLQRFDYEIYRKKSLSEPVSPVPILYPDLLHGTPSS